MAGTAKAYGLPFDCVLYEMSYANLLLYNAVIPVYHRSDRKKGKEEKDGRVLKADDPRNSDEVARLIDSMV